MKKRLMTGFGAAVLLAAATTGVASANMPDPAEGFICPVLGGQAGENGNANGITVTPNFSTVIGPEVVVPSHATNLDGAGSPGGEYASPGDTNYSAIWGVRP